MRLSASLLILAMSLALAGSLSVKSLVFPVESSTSYVEVTPLKALQLSTFTLCMRLATELQGEREIVLFAYRTQQFDELNVWRELDGRLSFYLRDQGVLFSTPGLGSMERHLCVTWDSQSGATAMFLDGRKTVTKIFEKSKTINGGGRVLLGQDLDNSGKFDPKQSFVGEIYNVNMWDSVLSATEIQDLISGKTVQRGNVIDWQTAKMQIHGQVEVITREL